MGCAIRNYYQVFFVLNRNFMSCSNFSWIDGGGGGGGAREKEQPLSDKHREVCSYE